MKNSEAPGVANAHEKGKAQGVAAVAGGSLAVAVDLRTAQLIRRVFLPHNPNKMRNCDPEVRAAAKTFISAFEAASARQENPKG